MYDLTKRLKDLRFMHGLTQAQVADYLNINQSTYSDYERGSKIPVRKLICLSYFYNVSMDYLLGLTNNPHPYKK